MCDVIINPYHNKISMQQQEFTAACIKWVLRVGIWNLKENPNNIHPPWLHDVLCLWRNIQKELVQSSLSNF